MLQLDIYFPYWLWLACALVGVVLFYTGNARVQTKLRTAGLGLICLAGLMLVFNLLVETPSQHCLRLTKELARDVVNQQWEQARQIMAPNTSFGVAGNAIEGKFDREQIVASAQNAVTHYGVKSITITSAEAVRNDTLITVTMTVFTTQDATLDRPVSTTWEFDWQNPGPGWRLNRIVLLDFGGQGERELQDVLK